MATADPLVGLVVGERYRLLRRIGEGGMGAVYQAEHVVLGRPFALKLLLPQLVPDSAALTRFQREACITARLQHQGIVQVTDFGRDAQAGIYLVMELLQGEDLNSRIRRDGPLNGASALALMREIADAFAYAHERGVIHRDVKSANIFLVKGDDGLDHAKVVDFGIARLIESRTQEDVRVTRTGVVLGSPAYMAPEQALGLPPDPRTDIYSLGIVFFEMVTGRVPFSGTTAFEVLHKQIGEVPPQPSQDRTDIHPGIEAVILRCLQKPMDARYPSGRALLADLGRIETEVLAGRAPTIGLEKTLDHLRQTLVADGGCLDTAGEADRRRLVAGNAWKAIEARSLGAFRRWGWWLLAVCAGLALAGGAGAWFLGRASVEPRLAPRSVDNASSLPEVSGPVETAGHSRVGEPTGPNATLQEVASSDVEQAVLVSFATHPLGGTATWKDSPGPAMPTPLALSLRAGDQGRVLVFSLPGHHKSEYSIDLAGLRANPSVVVRLVSNRPPPARPVPRKPAAGPWESL
jgi:hypothetical protein